MVELIEVIQFLREEIIEVYGSIDNIYIDILKPLGQERESTLNWISVTNEAKQLLAENTVSKVIICDISVVYSEIIKNQGKVLIHVGNPKLAVALVASRYFANKPQSGIHTSASILSSAKVSVSAHIGANCSIGKCSIGDNTIIYPNVTIYDNVIIGSNCIIHAGTVIGTDGLGCERRADGTLVKFPHFGGVVIENDVEIGANCQIAKGALSNTIIGQGTKINGLCFIAHNCILGRNVWITGCTMLAGTVKVGDNVNIFSGVNIREQRTIGKGAVIGMGSVVTKNVPEGETWVGSPAKKMGETK